MNAEPDTSPQRAAPTKGAPMRDEFVLVVDDDRDLGFFLCRAVEEILNVPAETAGNREDALQVVDRRCPMLILVDLSLPTMQDGLAVMQHIKANQRTSSVPIIAMSGLDPSQGEKICT